MRYFISPPWCKYGHRHSSLSNFSESLITLEAFPTHTSSPEDIHPDKDGAGVSADTGAGVRGVIGHQSGDTVGQTVRGHIAVLVLTITMSWQQLSHPGEPFIKVLVLSNETNNIG